MPDREIVIRGLEPIIGCAKQEKWGAWIDTLEDALALLKEQEPVKPHRNKLCKTWHCGNCDEIICSSRSKFNNYCRNCGRAVKWE